MTDTPREDALKQAAKHLKRAHERGLDPDLCSAIYYLLRAMQCGPCHQCGSEHGRRMADYLDLVLCSRCAIAAQTG